jgi:uncharacterized LabA/DUF88 family protein
MRAFYGHVPPIAFDDLGTDLGAHRIYYYDAIDYTKDDKESDTDYETRIEELEALHEYIDSRPGFHVRAGRVRKSPRKEKREQKGVDVLLAVDALEHAARGNMNQAIILTGDLDFEPLLSSLVRLGVRTKLVYVPRTTSKELMRAADEIQKITLWHFHKWAPPSFKHKFREVVFHYRQTEPDQQFEVVRDGMWDKRRVRLYKSRVASGNARLFVDWGDELREPSYVIEHADIDKLEKAFELTFGTISWRS